MSPWRIPALLAPTLLLAIGCQSSQHDATQQASPTSADAEAASMAPAPTVAVGDGTSLTGTVVESMDSGGYTYVLVNTGDEQVWAAGPPVKLAPGDSVRFDASMPMANFHSKTLDRTFARVYFTGSFEVVAP
jgi:hypothetical protein